MRLRHDPTADEIIAEDNKHVLHFADNNFNLLNCFNNENKRYCLEIGVGKGDFISNMGLKKVNINYVGIEKYGSVLIYALRKLQKNEDDITNVKLLHGDANKLLNFFEDNSFETIYLNFSDPWPKKRHAKRRLTSSSFLKKYQNLLVKDGEIKLKTDNDDFFAYSLEMLQNNPCWDVTFFTKDLYDSIFAEGNVPTEYETKFHNNGKNINMLIARKR